jgi:protein-histidine pros-kinase
VVARNGETRRLEVSLTPLAEGGSVKGRLYLLRDVTDARRAEAALTESEARFRSLLETAPDAIVISDPEGRIALVNRQAEVVFGYGSGELLDRRIEDLVPDGRRSAHAGHRARYLSNPSLRPMGADLDLKARRKDGSAT